MRDFYRREINAMCVGIPLQVTEVNGTNAIASDGARTEAVDLSLVGSQSVGTWILSFLGAAREVLTEEEAERIRDALAGLERVMNGGNLGNAFADLTSSAPALPPHLAKAHAAGKTQA